MEEMTGELRRRRARRAWSRGCATVLVWHALAVTVLLLAADGDLGTCKRDCGANDGYGAMIYAAELFWTIVSVILALAAVLLVLWRWPRRPYVAGTLMSLGAILILGSNLWSQA